MKYEVRSAREKEYVYSYSYFLFRDNPNDFFNRRNTHRRFENAVFKHSKHSLTHCLFLKGIRGGSLHDQLSDRLRDREHFMYTDAPTVAFGTFRLFLGPIKWYFFPGSRLGNYSFFFKRFQHPLKVNGFLERINFSF